MRQIKKQIKKVKGEPSWERVSSHEDFTTKTSEDRVGELTPGEITVEGIPMKLSVRAESMYDTMSRLTDEVSRQFMDSCDSQATGYVGALRGYRFQGKSYDADGKEIAEVHEKDCFCCRENLLGPNASPNP